MARTKEKWSGVVSGPFQVVHRHIEIPVTIHEMPDRPVVIVVEFSYADRFIRGFANVWGKAKARLARPQVVPPDSFDGDGS